MYDKARLFNYRRASRVNVYRLGDYDDYFYGYMVMSTRYLKYFDLQMYEEGFILRLPNKKQPKAIQPFHPQKVLPGECRKPLRSFPDTLRKCQSKPHPKERPFWPQISHRLPEALH